MFTRLCRWLVLATAVYALIHRLGTRWGATDAEVDGSLPGDDVVPHPQAETTHAVTIEAPPAAVWPWLVQAGYGRGGWYSETWLDPVILTVIGWMVPKDQRNIEPRPPSVDRILPEEQHLAVGDIVPDGPPGTAWFTVVAIEAERALVLHSDTHTKFLTPAFLHGTGFATSGGFTWNFVLLPVEGGRTRLILRTQSMLQPRFMLKIISPLFLLGDFAQARAILLGVKQRAEGLSQTESSTT